MLISKKRANPRDVLGGKGAEMRTFLYIIGLLLVLLYLVLGLDDFIWDLLTLFKRRGYRKQRLELSRLRSVPPKLLAMTVAAWHESNVLGDVIDNVIATTDYPRSMYHIFLGVYPNDPETISVAKQLAKRYGNVHVIINDKPGPTSKAQNLNHVIREIKKFEKCKNWRFASLTIHDSEDVVHPYELLATNYLLETHDAMQFPVFPIMRMPTFRSFFRTITTGTYADEFAENHFTTMVGRYSAGAFVPSAGTGFALSRKTLESFGDGDVLPSTSLTEDYRLSLTLFERGIQMYYVLEKVPRVDDRGRRRWDYITTRSLFPNTFRAAVRQKTRWILGITMQSFRFRDIFADRNLPLVGRYTLYKDLKAKVGNLLVFIGYPVFVYFIVSLFTPLTPIYPKGTLSWYLCFVVTAMMIERQLYRAVSIYNVYGMRSVFFSCLFPPLFPIRLVWGNVINMVSTFRAYRQKYFARKKDSAPKKVLPQEEFRRYVPDDAAVQSPAAASPKPIAWAKTDHDFLDKAVLERYRRTLGDTLLARGLLTPPELADALASARKAGTTLGSWLRSQNRISEEQLLDALSDVRHIPFVPEADLEWFDFSQFSGKFDLTELQSLPAVPLLRTETGTVFGFCDESPSGAPSALRQLYGQEILPVYLTRQAVQRGLQLLASGSGTPPDSSPILSLYALGKLNWEQVLLVHSACAATQADEAEMLFRMGLSDRLISSRPQSAAAFAS